MLRELPTNTLRAGPARAPISGKEAEQARLKSASETKLPSSDIEDDLEDFSSDPEDVDKPGAIQTTTLRRLQRGAQSGAVAAPSQAADLEDVLDDLATLALGMKKELPSSKSQNHQTKSLVTPAPRPESGDDYGNDDDDDNEDGDDDDDQPFYNRIVPSAAPMAASKSTANPKPGSLVLGEGGRYVLAPDVASKLYPHQVEGVKWLWSLFEKQRGGILGDDMGLGKTMQCSAFLAGLFGSGLVKRAIIIAPKTLLPHWIKELAVCGLKYLTREYFGSSESERSAALRSTLNGRGIIVTTYGMVQHNADSLVGPRRDRDGDAFAWDLMLLDEGHKIKNPKMKLVEELRKLPTRVKIIISGTPIQNNLMEMHALFDFTAPGLLGDDKSFKKNYEKEITKGQDKDASERERVRGAAIAAELRQRIGPYFLRREKKEVVLDGGSGSSTGAGGGDGDAGSSTSGAGGSSGEQRSKGLPRKFDVVVWLRMTPLQRRIYTAFLQSDDVRAVLNEKASPLAAITVLKKVCDHPALLTQHAVQSAISGANTWAKGTKGRRVNHHGYDSDFIDDSEEEASDSDSGGSSSSNGPGNHGGAAEDATLAWLGNAATLAEELPRELKRRGADASCKTAYVLALLERLHAEGHRTLIFSQSKVMLNILEAGVRAMGLTYCRIDGDVATAEDRQAEVHRFQTSKNIPVFLLTSQVGGLGLTLTAADRVIIVDPHWNPSVDNQSVDRAYRLGQTKDVLIYRLITCGTVEEKIYRKQVFKGGLSKTGTEEGIQFRYFSHTELRDLFSVTEEGLQQSATQAQLHDMHAAQRNPTPEVERHLEGVLKMEGVAGIHDHNLLFSQRPEEPVPTAKQGAAILSEMSGAGLVGVDALTDMLGKGMRISNADFKAKAAVEEARRNVADLTGRLERLQHTITHPPVKLPDGGARLKESARALERELAAAKAAYEALTSASGGGESPSTSSGGEVARRENTAGPGPRPPSMGPGDGRSSGVDVTRKVVPQPQPAPAKPDPVPLQLAGSRPPGRVGGFGSGPAQRAAAAASAGARASGGGEGIGQSGSNVFAPFAASGKQPEQHSQPHRPMPASFQQGADRSATSSGRHSAPAERGSPDSHTSSGLASGGLGGVSWQAASGRPGGEPGLTGQRGPAIVVDDEEEEEEEEEEVSYRTAGSVGSAGEVDSRRDSDVIDLTSP